MKTITLFVLSTCFLFQSLYSQTLNLNFPSVNGQVHALAVKGNTLFIGGDFIEVDEIPRKNLAAIDLNTGNLLDWAPVTDDKVTCIAIDDNNVAYICGDFQNINDTPRNNLGAISSLDGSLENWNPDIVFPGIPGMQTGTIMSIAIADDIIYIGGYFLSVNGSGRSNLAAINPQGTVLAWNPSIDIPLERIAIHDNILYISGPFMEVDGQSRLSFASFDLDTGNLTNWNPMTNNPGNSNTTVFPQDDHVYITGFFDQAGGESRERAASVTSNTGTALPWQVNFSDNLPIVTSFAQQGDRLYMAGDYILGGQSNLTALNPATGALDSWSANPNNPVNALWATDDKLIVGGNFTNISNEGKIGLAVYDLGLVNVVPELPDAAISVFPRPASNTLNISYTSDLVDRVELYDINGVLVKNLASPSSRSLTVAINDLAVGSYSLVFRSKGQHILKTVLVPIVR